MERLCKRPASAVRPAEHVANVATGVSAERPFAEMNSMADVRRWLDSETMMTCGDNVRVKRVQAAVTILQRPNPGQPDLRDLQKAENWNVSYRIAGRTKTLPEILADVQWLTDQFMHEDLPTLKLIQTGETVPLKPNETQLPIFRLETIMRLTQERRSKWIQCPNDVLTVDRLKQALNDWKDDYKTWMDAGSQIKLHRMPQKKKT